jgi:predicted NAD/FAD-binding protein
MQKNVAIIGSGIAGMGAARILHNHGIKFKLFEKENYIGGHTHTVYVAEDYKNLAIDTGFIVFNEITYPNLVKLFKNDIVNYENTDMSFSVQYLPKNLEFCGSSISQLFSQKKNIFNFEFYRLLYQIIKFNKLCKQIDENSKYRNSSIKDFFNEEKIGQLCLDQYLLPMAAALWSSPQEQILDFPVLSLSRFLKNHGMLGMNTQFQWKTVTGGSWSYRDKIISGFKDNIYTNEPVLAVYKTASGYRIETSKQQLDFDTVIFATHADQALSIIKDPTELEMLILSKFKYQNNVTTLHTDHAIMPRSKRAWASWNYRVPHDQTKPGTITYYMNKLQNLDAKKNYFVSLNAQDIIDPKHVIHTFNYTHPIFDVAALNAQESIKNLHLESRGRYFCGSYFRFGFHEDALSSSVEMCKHILKKDQVL